jgi:predicted nucleotidyltransferase
MDYEKDIIKELKELQNNVLAILIYGSVAKGSENERSDIDICIVAPNAKSSHLYTKLLPLVRKNYDIKIFEDMPLFLKMEVIKNHKIVYAKNVYQLYEYFYKFRKIWKDQEHRQKLTKDDIKILFG